MVGEQVMTENPDTPTPSTSPEAEAEADSLDSEVEIGIKEVPSDVSGSARETAIPEAPSGISPELFSDPYGEEVLDLSAEDFEVLLAEHADVMGDFREGEIVNAKVLRVTEKMVILEFGFKSEGAVPIDEFKDRTVIEPGQDVEVLLESL